MDLESTQFASSRRETLTDLKIEENLSDKKLKNLLFTRLVAKAKTFRNIDFRYTIFETCYLRNCVFDSCDFTGCRFAGSNFHGSSFSGCKFDYAWFERTLIDEVVLDTECPAHENLKRWFARTLRVNYQQIGDAQGANKAIRVELEATSSHLSKVWRSNESYYRKNYRGWARFRGFIEWLEFKLLDMSWGNGESPWKLLRTSAAVLAFLAVVDAVVFNDPRLVSCPGDFVRDDSAGGMSVGPTKGLG
jgi:hypothetical protein